MDSRYSFVPLGNGVYAIQVLAGNAALYFHGTTDDIRSFAREILTAANAHDAAEIEAKHRKFPVSEGLE